MPFYVCLRWIGAERSLAGRHLQGAWCYCGGNGAGSIVRIKGPWSSVRPFPFASRSEAEAKAAEYQGRNILGNMAVWVQEGR